MTGDVNLTHIRDAITWASTSRSEREAAFVQLSAAEAVIRAARAVLDYENHPTASALRDLRSAVAALTARLQQRLAEWLQETILTLSEGAEHAWVRNGY